ncbi:MAG: TIGR02444 family protein [Pseudomonadota bacterium]
MHSEPGAFWNWSIGIYGSNELEAGLIALQDNEDADVNMMLWCLWNAARGCEITAAGMTDAARISDVWRSHAAAPLRAVRRWLKTSAATTIGEVSDLRNCVKQVELESERVQQDYLERIAPSPARTVPDVSQCLALVRKNLSIYARACAIDQAALDATLSDALLASILDAPTRVEEK